MTPENSVLNSPECRSTSGKHTFVPIAAIAPPDLALARFHDVENADGKPNLMDHFVGISFVELVDDCIFCRNSKCMGCDWNCILETYFQQVK